MLRLAGASPSSNRIRNASEHHRLMLHLAASARKAGRSNGHNQIHIRVVVILQNRGNINHLALRIGDPHLQIFPLLKSTGLQSTNQSLHAHVRANIPGKINDSRLKRPSRNPSLRPRKRGCRRSRFAVAQIRNQKYRGEQQDEPKAHAQLFQSSPNSSMHEGVRSPAAGSVNDAPVYTSEIQTVRERTSVITAAPTLRPRKKRRMHQTRCMRPEIKLLLFRYRVTVSVTVVVCVMPPPFAVIVIV